MATKAKMTEAAKARLKELGAAKKAEGRASLKGFHCATWAAALDDVMEGRMDDAFPMANAFTSRGQFSGDDIRFAKGFRWTYSRHESGKERDMVSFVSLKHARPDQHADLIRWFGAAAVPVVEFKFQGPGRGELPVALFLYPSAPMLKLIWALWPGPKDGWTEKAGKYLHGYTPGAVANMSPLRSAACDDAAVFDAAPAGFVDAVADNRHFDACRALAAAGLLPAKRAELVSTNRKC